MIQLELLQKEDFIRILEWNESKTADGLLQWAGPKFNYPLTYEQIESYFINEVYNENATIFVYKVLLESTREMIGTIELREVDKQNKVGKICRFLIGTENNRGKNIGSNALKEALRIGFEQLQFERITLGVFDFNHGAIKCYEKVGFVKVKVIENIREATTGYWNLVEMEITKAKCETLIK